MCIENRKVTLYCPTCGNDQFATLDETDNLVEAPDTTRFQCSDCKSVITKAELIESNQDSINANIEDVKNEAIKEIDKKLKKLFK